MGSQAEITFEQIRERAYELWERHHRPEGFQIEFWLMAERELRAERKRAAAARPVAPDLASGEANGPNARPRDDGGRPVHVEEAERSAPRIREH